MFSHDSLHCPQRKYSLTKRNVDSAILRRCALRTIFECKPAVQFAPRSRFNMLCPVGCWASQIRKQIQRGGRMQLIVPGHLPAFHALSDNPSLRFRAEHTGARSVGECHVPDVLRGWKLFSYAGVGMPLEILQGTATIFQAIHSHCVPLSLCMR